MRKRKGRGCAPPNNGTPALFGWRAQSRGRFARVSEKLVAIALLLLGASVQALFADQKNDDRIYDQVRIRLTDDPDVKGGVGLDVSVKDGVVTLKGRVDTEKAKNRATKLAKKVKGVKDVDNELTVGSQIQ